MPEIGRNGTEEADPDPGIVIVQALPIAWRNLKVTQREPSLVRFHLSERGRTIMGRIVSSALQQIQSNQVA
jgi:hypothetical protein